MWTPTRITRTPSTHSVALSVTSASSRRSTNSNSTSSQGSSTENQEDDNFGLDDHDHDQSQDMWKAAKKAKIALNSPEYFLAAAQQHETLRQKLHMQVLQQEQRQRHRRESVSTDTSTSHSTTLAEEEVDLKTPTAVRMGMAMEDKLPEEEEEEKKNKAMEQSVTRPAGPMERLLHSLMRKVADLERGAPTVMAEEYEKLDSKVQALETEKMIFIENHTALLALRNEDLSNLIKVRCLLAEESREHAAIRKLRDDDLENVLVLREKLARATWSKHQQQEHPDRQSSASHTPIQRQSRSDGDDLWQQARTAAMEQRIMELERANKELRAQAVGGGNPSGDLLGRVESMFEDSLKHREKMATRVQQLRSEKEALQKEVAAFEDRNTELEGLVEKLQRNMGF